MPSIRVCLSPAVNTTLLLLPVHTLSEKDPESAVIPSIVYEPFRLKTTFVIVAPDTVKIFF